MISFPYKRLHALLLFLSLSISSLLPAESRSWPSIGPSRQIITLERLIISSTTQAIAQARAFGQEINLPDLISWLSRMAAQLQGSEEDSAQSGALSAPRLAALIMALNEQLQAQLRVTAEALANRGIVNAEQLATVLQNLAAQAAVDQARHAPLLAAQIPAIAAQAPANLQNLPVIVQNGAQNYPEPNNKIRNILAFTTVTALSAIARAYIVGITPFINETFEGSKSIINATRTYLYNFFYKDLMNAALANAIDQKDITGVKGALKSADINAKFGQDMTPLHLAVIANNDNIVTLLLQKGARVNARMFARLTPLHLAAQNSSRAIVEDLIRYRGDVNARAEHGITPLHLAAARQNIKAMKALIANDANVNALDKNHETALDWARREKSYNAAYLLVENKGVSGSELK